MCESFHTVGISLRRPCQSTTPSARHASSFATGTAAGLSSSGAPIRVKRNAGWRARATRAASTNSPHALVPQHPRDQRCPDRPVRLGRRREADRVDAGAGDDNDAAPINAEPCDESRVVRVLGQADAPPAVQRPTKRPTQQRAQQPRADVAGREHVAEAGERTDGRRDSGEPRCYGAIEHRLHGKMVDDVRALGPIEAPQRGDRAQVRERRDAAPLHGNGQHPYPFRADRVAMGPDRAGYGDGKAGVPRRARYRQTMRVKESVIAGREQQLGSSFVRSGVEHPASVTWLGHRLPRCRPLTASGAWATAPSTQA